jgi:hypothetical protein
VTDLLAQPVDDIEIPPGYYRDRWYGTSALMSLPWPDDVADLPPSLAPALINWAEWRTYEQTGIPGLIHPITGERWQYTPGQRRFLHQWYSWRLDDEVGARWLWRRGAKRGAKGTGKDPFGGSMCLGELIGPTRLAQHPDTGAWIGVRHRLPLVQIASNSEAQSKDLLRVANSMLPAETRDYFAIDCGQTRTILKDSGARLEVLTASEDSAEGDPATFIVLNETHHMTSTSGGHRIAAVARRNVAKSPVYIQARMVDLTNAHEQGEDSVAERTFESWQDQVEGRSKLRDILYDSIEAPPQTDLADEESLRAGMRAAYCDAPWTDIERKIGEVYDSETTEADSIRYYLNGLGEDENAWCSPVKFRLLERPNAGENKVKPGSQMTMFLDCSKSSDSTALMGCRLSDGYVFTLGCWSRPPGKRGDGWLAPREEVDAVVRGAFAAYRVEWFGVDPSPALDDTDESLYWMALVDQWHRDFRRKLRVWATGGEVRGSSVLFDMRIKTPGGIQRNAEFTRAAMMTRLDIDEFGTLHHDGDGRLIRHVGHSKRRTNPWGESLSKKTRDSKDHVDLAVAMVGARMGRRLVLNSGKVRERSGGAMF